MFKILEEQNEPDHTQAAEMTCRQTRAYMWYDVESLWLCTVQWNELCRNKKEKDKNKSDMEEGIFQNCDYDSMLLKVVLYLRSYCGGQQTLSKKVSTVYYIWSSYTGKLEAVFFDKDRTEMLMNVTSFEVEERWEKGL